MALLHKLRRENLESRALQNKSLRRLGENLRALVVPNTVPRVADANLTVAAFLRDYVAPSQPVIVTQLSSEEWPCLDKWSDDYLLRVAGDTEVSINMTPNGLGDAVDAEGRFIRPCEERMRFKDFWRRLCGRRDGDEVLYLSKQNDCLREELPQLTCDIPSTVALAGKAFGNEPDAVNLWIGEDQAISSCHKDHYENLFVVVRGEKVFTLLPPGAAPFLYERECRPAEYARAESGNGWEVVPDPDGTPSLPWIPVDVASPDLNRFPNVATVPTVEARVRRGEMLYIPAMWYHRVSQVGLTIGINYWHDMRFDASYCYHQYLRDSAGLPSEGSNDA